MNNSQTIYLAADHAGVAFKAKLIESLKSDFPNFIFNDLGPNTDASVDYPDYAAKAAKEVAKNNAKGILICGSGLGMCISANKVNGVRAVSAWDTTTARLSRQHNNANIVCLGARLTGIETALDIIRTFIKTEFEGGRHEKRVQKISDLEKSDK